MDKIICLICSEPNSVIWMPLHSYIVDYIGGKPVGIITYYLCSGCHCLVSLYTKIVLERIG
mgnify:CR=1 FL=1